MSQINILIVEDELIIAKTTAKKLENQGYKISKIVTSGQAAIEHIKSDPPDLILMDIAIKGTIDGVETAAIIKGVADIPVIFLTAYANDEIIERASKAGGYGYLIKPYRDKELQATVKMTLSKYREQSTIQKALQSTVSEYSSQYEDIYTNALTNLPNQLFLRDLYDYFACKLNSDSSLTVEHNKYLQSTKETAQQQSKHDLVAVYNISLARLDKISNHLTKEKKEKLVQEIAQRLSNCVKTFDFQTAIVYLEDDNYLMISALDNKSTAQTYGHNVLEQLREAFYLDDQEIFLPTSIGVAFNPTNSENIDELLEQSRKAQEYAQQQGSNRCQQFTFAFNIKNSRASDTLAMESFLYHALKKQELELYYQPKINLQNRKIVGAEALIRWNHPLLGRISADKFIPLAEESGLIRPISEWVFNSACLQMKAWHDSGLHFLKIGINLSSFQFRQSDLFHQMTQTLFKTALDPQCLELELTEKILVENIKTNIQRLHLLKKLGIQIALDDFGTGYSSLGYLQQFPFDILKIDSCFIRNLDDNEVNAVITKSTIEMAHQLGLKVVAEGVETEAELEYLLQHQCDEIQGYIYSRPVSANEFYRLAVNDLNSTVSVSEQASR